MLLEDGVTVDNVKGFAPCLPALLPMRSRGTRVWILCSRFLTRARISDTIWTPLLFDAVMGMAEVVVIEVDVARLGRGMGVRGVRLRDAENVGNVLERATGGVDIETENLLGWKPARWSKVDWPEVELKEVDGGREGVETEDLSVESSDRLKSGGGGVLNRLSSSVDGGDEKGREDEGTEEADDSEWMLGRRERAVESWSLRMDISTPASSPVLVTRVNKVHPTYLVIRPLTVDIPPQC